MTSALDETSELFQINEKLYIDTYFRLLKSDNSSDTKNNLLELLVQLKSHCKVLNIPESSLEKLKSELIAEYFHVVDSSASPDLLSIVPDAENISKNVLHPDQVQEVDIKDSLKELRAYFNKINLNSNSEKHSSIIRPENNHANKNESKPQIIPATKPCRTTYPTKRPAEETSGTSTKFSTKRNNAFTCNKPKQSSKLDEEKPKPAGTGFISASSMYRNPLKKKAPTNAETSDNKTDPKSDTKDDELTKHESLKNFDKKIVNVILNEIMDFSPDVKWTDIAGLEFVKTTVQEIVIWPLLRPDIFTGLRAPPRGILLFGPPGTGKTLIGKCIATESNSTFFCISASSLASKWVGESEQLVRALFAIAHINQPAVIFVDEIDSLLSQRSDKDQDFTRKLKTEFLVQFDGAKTSSEDRVLVVGATNRPHELDEAARRRFVKRLYVPLPEELARRQIVQKLLTSHQHDLSENDLQRICDETKGYSGSDVAHLCKEAAMGPIRSIGPENIKTVSLDAVRSINLDDFLHALRQVRASVAQDDLDYYLEWNKKFGSFGA